MTADVYPYNDAYKPILTCVPNVSGAMTYHHPNGQSYIIVIIEVLYNGTTLKNTFLNLNQTRYHGHGFWDHPYDEERALSTVIVHANSEKIPYEVLYSSTMQAKQKPI